MSAPVVDGGRTRPGSEADEAAGALAVAEEGARGRRGHLPFGPLRHLSPTRGELVLTAGLGDPDANGVDRHATPPGVSLIGCRESLVARAHTTHLDHAPVLE